MVKVSVILPSRGLIFSQTAEELLDNLRGTKHKIFFSHKKPIPECFEDPTNEALKDKSITHLWFVEDDMVLPPDTLKKMLEADVNAVTYDYPVTKDGNGAVFFDQGGEAVFGGTGCLLVKRSVFDNLNKPYFTDKVRWSMLNYGESVKLTGSYGSTGYGTHDITFCVKLWNNGVKLNVLKPSLAQRKLISLGKAGSNNGAHKIEVWKRIKKDARLKKIQAQPLAIGAKGKLVTVDTPTGGINTTRAHADSLVAQGMATYPPRRLTIIDDSEVTI
jgi:hypothetical protein